MARRIGKALVFVSLQKLYHIILKIMATCITKEPEIHGEARACYALKLPKTIDNLKN